MQSTSQSSLNRRDLLSSQRESASLSKRTRFHFSNLQRATLTKRNLQDPTPNVTKNAIRNK